MATSSNSDSLRKISRVALAASRICRTFITLNRALRVRAVRTSRRARSVALSGSILLLAIAGCVTTPVQKASLGNEFVGVWTNANPNFYNWWVITPDHVVNYGIVLDHGKCVGHEARILSKDRIDVPFGNAARVTLRIDGGALIFALPDGRRAVHYRTIRQAICRNGDSYFEGAPYPQK